MNEVVALDECRDEISGGKYPSRSRISKSNSGGGGGMDDVLKRLGAVESTVSEIRTQVSGISATLPHLATKADFTAVRVEVSELRTEVGAIAAVIPHLATKADLKEEIGGMRGEIGEVKGEIGEVKGEIGGVKGEIGGVKGEIGAVGAKLSADIRASETRTIQWTIGIIIAVGSLAFTIARYVH